MPASRFLANRPIYVENPICHLFYRISVSINWAWIVVARHNFAYFSLKKNSCYCSNFVFLLSEPDEDYSKPQIRVLSSVRIVLINCFPVEQTTIVTICTLAHKQRRCVSKIIFAGCLCRLLLGNFWRFLIPVPVNQETCHQNFMLGVIETCRLCSWSWTNIFYNISYFHVI